MKPLGRAKKGGALEIGEETEKKSKTSNFFLVYLYVYPNLCVSAIETK